MVLRIAVGGIHTECSTYSPVLQRMKDFRVLRGGDLSAHEYFAFLGQYEAEFLPLLHARAIPGGPVARNCYEALKSELLDRLAAAGPLDGIYLAMHGAVHVEDMQDAEGDLIGAIRTMVGPDLPIAVSYDLHGNVSQRIIDAIDIFAAYRTAPHIDTTETMSAAVGMLVRALRNGLHPGVTWAKIPLLLPGERSSTEDEPARRLYAALPMHDRVPGIWRSDLMIGYVWADEPRATACAVVTAIDAAQAEATATRIAADFWAARNEFGFGPITGPLEEMLDRAAKASTSPVILADSGDNPTGGGVGDRADVLASLIAQSWPDALLAGIADHPATVACLAAGEGATLSVTIGGSLDPSAQRVTATVKVLRIDGAGPDAQAVVAIGGIRVVLAARRRPYHDIADFTRLGLDPAKERLLVVKSGYLSPELAPLANPGLMALTDGAVNQDISHLRNLHRSPGTLPFEPNPDYTPLPIRSARFMSGS